jgi:hypothetical protein
MGFRGIVGVAICIIAVAMAGCGSSGAGSDEDQVRQTSSDFLDAIRDQDGDRACDLLSEQARERVDRFARRFGQTTETDTDCAKIMDLARHQFPSDFHIVNVDVDSDKATASADGEFSVRLPLTREGDDWKVNKSDY